MRGGLILGFSMDGGGCVGVYKVSVVAGTASQCFLNRSVTVSSINRPSFLLVSFELVWKLVDGTFF